MFGTVQPTSQWQCNKIQMIIYLLAKSHRWSHPLLYHQINASGNALLWCHHMEWSLAQGCIVPEETILRNDESAQQAARSLIKLGPSMKMPDVCNLFKRFII
jgi:hypothetical protein